MFFKKEITEQYNPNYVLQYLNIKDKDLALSDQKSLVQVKESLKLNPSNIEALVESANILRSVNEDENAIKVLEYANKVSAGNIAVLQMLAPLYVNINKYKEAEDIYFQIIDINPRLVSPFESLLSMYDNSMLVRSVQFPNKANRILDSNLAEDVRPEILRILGFYYYKFDDYQSAKKIFNEYIQFRPEDEDILKILEEINN